MIPHVVHKVPKESLSLDMGQKMEKSSLLLEIHGQINGVKMAISESQLLEDKEFVEFR